MALTKINSSVIANNTIAVGNIADNSVDATKIASNSILTRHIDDNQIGIDQLNVSDGSNGQFLKTNGSGTLSFGTVSTTTALDDIATGDAATTLATSSGDITLDTPGDIILDADGGQVRFSDGGSAIGEIQQVSNDLTIYSTASGHNGLRFHANGILPTDNAGAIVDNDADLGDPSYRFKDLRLGGSAYINGNVGIGTTNPGGTLHVQMSHTSTDVTAANSNETLVLGNSGTGNGVYNAIKFGGNQQDMYIMSFNNNQQADRRLGFFLGSVAGDAVADERLSILGNGNVGIGTTSPSTLLHLGGTAPGDSIIRQDSTSSGTNWEIGERAAGKWQIFEDDSDSIVATFMSTGKVGIGTESPAETLHVKRADGTALIVESSNDQNNTGDRINIEFRTDAAQGIAKIIGGKEGNYQSAGARSGYLAFQTINANSYGERMRITYDGKVGIGTTSPAAPLHISKAISSSSQTTVLDLESVNSSDQGASQTCQIDFSLIDSNTNTGVPQVRIGAVGNDVGNQAYEAGGRFSIYLASQNYPTPSLNEKFRIDEQFNGDTYTNDGSISSLSDVRVKTNIQDLTDGIDVLKQLRPVTFQYNNDGTDLGAKDGVTRYGLIADEVKSVAPHYVNESRGYIKGELVEDYKTLSLTRMIPMLMKSIQELSAELDAAKARITTLEG